AGADPYLEVHRIRPSDEVVGGGSQDPGPLHVLHCLDPALELTRRAAYEEEGQRQAHAEIADEVHEGLVYSAGLSRLGIHPTRLVERADLLAIEDNDTARPIAPFRLHAQPVGTAEGRSEERRVGKECRSEGWACQLEKTRY